LYYFRARYYDAQLGRFVGRDPLGYVDGMSLYQGYFVPGGVDPFGLDWWDETWLGNGLSIASAAGKGLAQGGLNTINGVQDSVIGLANLPGGAVNSIAWAEEQLGILPTGSARVPYIPSPDWSRDLIVQESGTGWGDSHNWSKGLSAGGLEILSGAALAKLAKLRAIGKLDDVDDLRHLDGLECISDEAGEALLNQLDEAPKKTETVQRWMSEAELQATRDSKLLRGGRDGTHFVSDAANSSAQRARQRLALPQTPEKRVTMEVPAETFSPPSRVKSSNNMQGGGMERTATGNVPVTIKKVDGNK